ncbi:alpha/beta hydrolase [uncultured Sphingomonas sp.]|uniref:alpha/beta hydrolase n=1 Tax=uncultured Sphingomonas sp. TaxID=158754 RepID=UPI002614738B|nr:alpha/beta hydrolase [uncultured Sphingomonas sp.]
MIALLIVGGAYLLGVTALAVGQRWFIYRPPASAKGYFPAGFDRITLRTSDGLDLVAAYRPAAAGRPTLVYFHGNGDSLEGANRASALLRQRGYGLLLVEYRGYADNPGKPGEQGLYRDGRAALDWLAGKGIASSGVILIGYSLGSGIASQLASEREVGGLALISPFSRLADAASHHFPYVPVRWLLRDRYDTIDKLRGRRLRVLVLHGDSDRVIPWTEGRDVAGVIPGAQFEIVHGAGHELAFLPATQDRIVRWLARLQPGG